jgi:hypothetical protein
LYVFFKIRPIPISLLLYFHNPLPFNLVCWCTFSGECKLFFLGLLTLSNLNVIKTKEKIALALFLFTQWDESEDSEPGLDRLTDTSISILQISLAK